MPPARLALFAATLGGIVLAVYAVAAEPPPLAVSIACAVGYVALVLAGVLALNLRMFADALVRGPDDARGVALTFDDGPDPVHTPQVLDLLDQHGAKATFFVIGKKVEQHPEVAREIVRRGHAIGVHGFAHDRLFSLRGPKRVRADLRRAKKVIARATGQEPSLFRPPIGHTNPTIARVAEELGLVTVGWSIGARDGLARTRASDVVARVGRALGDGAIVLLHDAAERGDREPAALAALPGIFDALAAKNLVVAHLPEWLEG